MGESGRGTRWRITGGRTGGEAWMGIRGLGREVKEDEVEEGVRGDVV